MASHDTQQSGIGANPPSAKQLAIIVGSATLIAILVVCGAILPAEFHRDPLGIGKATGLLKLSAPKEVNVKAPATGGLAAGTARAYDEALHNDEVEIRLAAAGDPNRGDELEWKLRMKAGQAVVYSWNVAAPPEEFYSDFHSQSDPQPEVKVMSHKEGVGAAANGVMIAPFDGIHGWYLQNQSLQPVVVHLKLAGFYTMRPDPYAPE